MTKPFYHNISIQLHIVRNGHHYFFTRRENGHTVVGAKLITAERAETIMRLNAEDPAVTISERKMGDAGFSWLANIVVQVEDKARV